MSRECPKCHYVRVPTDTAPDYECPRCGIVYAKAEIRRLPAQDSPRAGMGIPMIDLFELVSFHLALFFGSTLLFFLLFFCLTIGNPTLAHYGPSTIFPIWLVSCGLVVTFVSYVTKAYAMRTWSRAKTGSASLFCLLGHLAPVAAVYLLTEASGREGTGMVIVPVIGLGVLGVFFYLVGVLMTIGAITDTKQRS